MSPIAREDSLLVANQRNEADRFAKRSYRLAVDHANELELLGVSCSYGNDHAAALAELGEQFCWQLRCGSGNEDRVERRGGGKADRAISSNDLNVGITERGENF